MGVPISERIGREQELELRQSLTYLVGISLISPERALRLGSMVETAVFVPTNSHFDGPCRTCGSDPHTPPLFQTGRIITSETSCKELSGDVYFFPETPEFYQKQPYNPHDDYDTDSWYAVVQPLGRVTVRSYDKVSFFSAPAVRVREIFGFCERKRKKVTEGVIFDTGDNDGLLYEFCLDERHEDFRKFWSGMQPRYKFEVRDGSILLT